MPGELAAHLPICACGTMRPIRVNTYHNQFIFRERSAFVLACSYYKYILSQQSKSGSASGSMPFFSSHSLKACGSPRKDFYDIQYFPLSRRTYTRKSSQSSSHLIPPYALLLLLFGETGLGHPLSDQGSLLNRKQDR